MSEQDLSSRDSKAAAATAANQPHRYEDGPGPRMDGPALMVFLELALGPAHHYKLIDANKQLPHGRVDVSGALVYGDGDHAQASVAPDGNFYRISDDGGAVWRAALQAPDGEPTETLRFFAESTARSWDIKFTDDEFHISAVWPFSLAEYVQRVLLASWDAERWIWKAPSSL